MDLSGDDCTCTKQTNIQIVWLSSHAICQFVSVFTEIAKNRTKFQARFICILKSLLSVNIVKNSWETVGKKRSLGKEGGPSEIKESRERKGGEREVSRGRGGSNRRGRGISRGREGKRMTKI